MHKNILAFPGLNIFGMCHSLHMEHEKEHVHIPVSNILVVSSFLSVCLLLLTWFIKFSSSCFGTNLHERWQWQHSGSWMAPLHREVFLLCCEVVLTCFVCLPVCQGRFTVSFSWNKLMNISCYMFGHKIVSSPTSIRLNSLRRSISQILLSIGANEKCVDFLYWCIRQLNK